MNIRKALLLLAITGLVFANFSAYAEEVCENFDDEPDHFKNLYAQAKELGREICFEYGRKINSTTIASQYAAFASEASQQVEIAFAGKSFLDELQTEMQHFKNLAQKGVEKNELPSFITPPGQDFDSIFFRFDNSSTQGKANLEADECTQPDKPTCEALFTALKTAIEQYKKPYAQLIAGEVTAQWTQLGAEWDRYFEQARSQTLWDAFLTTFMEQDHLAQSRLVGPMEKQWFVIHPSIVIENVSAALDGDEVSEALAIEWFGVNWWDKKTSPIGYPFGISLTSIFSDRASVEDAGHGVMFHLDNSMSIGWADHDGDAGIYVTVDLLNLAAKKKQRWEDYKEEIDTIVEDKLEELEKLGQL